ncbi:phage Gp37/Gp68 family protein [Thalassolituus oleivorans]|jgi:protein gp37|uniref:Gp68 n=1 Tax=Thalassolituus oleivorans MIL-1 TaxID=1298593 RepID=M5DW80_9GAMM|nr:phage Gp37/Gp68 family protein [Thalassolituus oleivorans]PCI49444.1 MAG: phage Gp37/Gp68 family protein [Oceanospirillales bacterium]PHQ87343.1 MAG: phage Gp37/Gp68 family protein [Thalassobium sp.]CCU73523.1 gp68 [Thalassolituus oleivorans MIL-1]
MSKIEWTEQTWNPVTGCTKVSPGCKHCYAEVMAKRLKAMGAAGYDNGFKLSLMPERLQQPLQRRKPTMYFVNSMSDLFQEEVPDSFIDQVMDVIRQTPHHTYQILTKRSKNMLRYFETRDVPDNAWLGVSVEDRKYGKPRIKDLAAIKADTRFLSIEPLLEDLGQLNLKNIHWVIVGGESGFGARPMMESWALNIRNQCLSADVDFFFKQWGAWGVDGIQRNKKANGRLLDGQIWDMIPAIAV